jgi:dihydrofolate reductase
MKLHPVRRSSNELHVVYGYGPLVGRVVIPCDQSQGKDRSAGLSLGVGRRRTWESLPPRFRPLPGRTNIVITSYPAWSATGAIRAHSLQSALSAAEGAPGSEEVWIIGGGTIFREAMSLADTASITRIHSDVEGGTYAPSLGPEWQLTPASPVEGWTVAGNGTLYRIETWRARR